MTNAADLRLGDHVCLPFDTDDALRAHVAAFTAAGLDAGHRVMVFTPTSTVDAMTGWLRRHHRASTRALDTGQLQIHSPDDVHLAGGCFEPDRMMTGFAHATEQAHADGYPGLRVTVDMSWALQPVPGVEHLFDFEAKANRLFLDHRLAAVCAYDERRFSPAAINQACAAHPSTPGMATMRFTRPPRPGLNLSGEIDIGNRQALDGLLTTLPYADTTLDLTGVTFIDAGGAGALLHFAQARGDRTTTIVAGPKVVRLLNLLDAATVAGLTVVAAKLSTQLQETP
ncbi:MEDS domain-containing protein [Actinoplanes sp. NPDC051346]|uniref:MEDS domain-containing protein n=1 Tax=Actinoplanes sp. NPDC051346 TaxID=3155048 RepID=UPI0034145B3B